MTFRDLPVNVYFLRISPDGAAEFLRHKSSETHSQVVRDVDLHGRALFNPPDTAPDTPDQLVQWMHRLPAE